MAARFILILNLLTLMVYLTAPASAQTPPVLTPAQKQAEEAAARSVVEKFIAIKPGSPPPADLFSNRTAAMLAIALLTPIAISNTFASLGTPAQKAKGKQIEGEVSALGVEYGFSPDPKKPVTDAEIDTAESHGREFYAGAIALIEKVNKGSAGKPKFHPKGKGFPSSDNSRNIADYTFTAVSPTEVKVATKDQSSPPLEVVREDGQWRFDLGGIRDLYREIQSNADQVATSPNDKKKPRRESFEDALANGDTSRVKELILAHPALVNQEGMVPPLQKAIFFEYVDMVKLLVDHGAKVDAVNDFGRTALMQVAFINNEKALEIAKILLSAGANVNINDGGETALSIATNANDTAMVELLKAHGAR